MLDIKEFRMPFNIFKRIGYNILQRLNINLFEVITFIVSILLWVFLLIIFFQNYYNTDTKNNILARFILLITNLSLIIGCFTFSYLGTYDVNNLFLKIIKTILQIPLYVIIMCLVGFLIYGICYLLTLIPYIPGYLTDVESVMAIFGALISIILINLFFEEIHIRFNKKHYDIVYCQSCGIALPIDKNKSNFNGKIMCANCSKMFLR